MKFNSNKKTRPKSIYIYIYKNGFKFWIMRLVFKMLYALSESNEGCQTAALFNVRILIKLIPLYETIYVNNSFMEELRTKQNEDA